jgi:hypothetical protein
MFHHRRYTTLVLLVSMIALVGVLPTLAGKPDHQIFQDEGSDWLYCDTDGIFTTYDDNGDGWPDRAEGYEYLVEGSWWANVNIHTFYDKDDNPTYSRVSGVFRGTLTRPDTGESVTERQTWVDTWDMAGTYYTTNHSWRIIRPGEPLIYRDVGRVIFDLTTGEIVIAFMAGHHPSLEGDVPEYCGLFGDGQTIAIGPPQ